MSTVERNPQRRSDGAARRSSAAGDSDRSPPQNLEAERAVLGSILLLPEVFDEVALIVRPADFSSEANRTIYEHLLEMHDTGKRVDPMLLVESLRAADQYEAVGGAAYLAEVGRQVPTAAHAEYYAQIVADRSVLRSLIHAGTDIVHDAYEPGTDTREKLGRAEEKIFSILENRGQGDPRPINDILHQAMDRIDARIGQSQTGGLATGFVDFDKTTGGLQKSELVILAARPSMGKTALALNIAEHVTIELGQPALFVSLEMSAMELADRMLCSHAEVNGQHVRNGTLSKEEMAKLIKSSSELSKAPLLIDDSPSRTMTEIAANARRMKRRGGLSLVVIDYLQLIEPDNPRDPRQEQVARIARRLKGLARELEVPVLCLAQLNRQVESSRDNKPQLSNLRESGAIEQDADVVMFVHREEYYASDEQERDAHRGEAEILIRKQRNGPTGDVKLVWVHEFTRFRNAMFKPHAEFEADYSDDF